MKRKIYLILLITVNVLLSCKKDNDTKPESGKNLYRIKQVTHYNNDQKEWKSDFNYEEEKLSHAMDYKMDEIGNWIENYKTEIIYNGNNVSEIGYSNKSGSWKLNERDDYIIENELMIEEIFYDYENYQWFEIWKYIYQYSDNNLISWERYNSDNGFFKPVSKGEYTYENNKLTEYKEFEKDLLNNWNQIDKETFSYSEDILTGWIDFDTNDSDNWIPDYKCDFIYSGDNITREEYFYWDVNTIAWKSHILKSFNYNDDGYLIEEMNNNGDRKVYEYEEGHGNAKYFWYYPEDLIYCTPVIKSSRTKNKYIPHYKKVMNRNFTSIHSGSNP